MATQDLRNGSGGGHNSAGGSKGLSAIHVTMIVCFALMCQSLVLTQMQINPFFLGSSFLSSPFSSSSLSSQEGDSPTTTHTTTTNLEELLRQYNPLGIPQGQASNLPSIRIEDKTLNDKRKIYGGEGDGKHLGGFTEIDMHGITPTVWKHIVQKWFVQSAIDVGCGRGISTSWFYTHGLRTQCVEGSHDAVTKNMMPDKSLIVEHDFSRGPWWPEHTFDVAWAVEFLEHVNLQYHYNYITTFRKAAILLVSSSRWGGWHHVEVHPDEWWIRKYESYGFKYDEALTTEIRNTAAQELHQGNIFPPTGKKFNAQHVRTSMKVFVNPVVAALPEHAHLFGGFGCYEGRTESREIINRECGTGRNGGLETPLDPAFHALNITDGQDQAWYEIVNASLDKAKI